MATQRIGLKNKCAYVNVRLRKLGSKITLTQQEFLELDQKIHQFSKASLDLLRYDPIVLEVVEPFIGAYLLADITQARHFKYSEDGIHALSSGIELVPKIIYRQEQAHAMISLGRDLESRDQEENAPQEYSVNEFAELTHLHPHTIRKRFKDGELKGRKDSKGIFIAATELEKFKPQNNAG